MLRISKTILLIFWVILSTPFLTTTANAEPSATNPFGFNINYISISKINTTLPTSTGVFIAWVNDATSNNRIYYGLNESDVNNYINGNWSIWDNNTSNPFVRITGLTANQTYYYKSQVWTGGVPDNTKPVKSFKTLKPGIYTSPAEATISPRGSTLISPTNFRTINITASPLDSNGRYIKGLSLQAIIYDKFGNEITRINLIGEGPYYGNYIVPDYTNEGGYIINVTGYPDADKIRGEFSVISWSCTSCHSAGGANYPSTFNVTIVHPEHFDTKDINVTHEGADITSTDQCGSCHSLGGPKWVPHPSGTNCVNCHKSPSGGNPALTCNNCHSNKTTGYSLLSQKYGVDEHENQTCNSCHGELLSINNRPTCPTCHPRPGSSLITVPDRIDNKSHSSNKTVDCGLCHNNEHDIKDLTLDNKTCKICHPGITHAGRYQCTSCHGSDPHDVKIGGGCIGCHGTNYADANPTVERTFVDIGAFNESIHQNINNIPPYTVNDNDCTTCHFNKDMERTNIKRCNDCHRRVEQWHGNANITTNLSELSMNQ